MENTEKLSYWKLRNNTLLIQKSIEFFQEEQYRELPYGTIYYVAGTATEELNACVKREARKIAKQINQNEDLWIGCKIVYLDTENTLFPSCENAKFYSAMLPTIDNLRQGYSFLVATLQDCEPAVIGRAFSKYFETLQQMFDEILDTGEYKKFHLLFAEDCLLVDDMVCIHLAEGQKPISGLPPREQRPRRSQLSRLEITPNTYDVLLTDYDRRKIPFTAQVKALYVLFLLHPKGICMKDIRDYKDEYKSLYFRFTDRSDMEKLRDSIERLFDAWTSNALNVKKSQCSEALRQVIPEDDIRRYYEIEVNRGKPHMIHLDRKLVTYPESLLSKETL